MIKRDFHIHTCYCDGKNTPEEMVLSAVGLGMDTLGFSGHAYTGIEGDPGMDPDALWHYMEDITQLKSAYSGRIRILTGIEWDLYSVGNRDQFEYVIGSVHYFEPREDAGVDNTPGILTGYVRSRFGGDWSAAARCYYDNVSQVVEATGADIIGHFDLITKFNEGGKLFDTSDDRYIEAWQTACDILLKTGKPFEINTGAMTRGYRTGPYPADDIIDYIGTHGGTFILSSDSHAAASLMYGFEELEAMLQSRGYRLTYMP